MKNTVLLLLLYFVTGNASASGCIKLYHQASLAHDELVSVSYGTDKFFEDLARLEDSMFEAMNLCKDNARLLGLMSEIQITARQAPLAQLYAQKALGIDPNTWQSQHAMGSYLLLVKEYDKAVPYIEKASQLVPDRVGLKLSLCRAQTLAEQYNGAVTTCSMVINSEDQSYHPLAYYFRGLAHSGMNNKDAATADRDKARSLGVSF